MGKFYKIYMVLLSNTLHIEMLKGTISQQLLALASFMERPGGDMTGSGTSEPVVDDLLAVVRPRTFIVSNNLSTGPPQPAFPQPTYEMNFQTSLIRSPPDCGSTVQSEPQVVPETLPQRLTKLIANLTKKQCSLVNFCNGFKCLGVPAAVVEIILMKLNLIREKNGKKFVDVRHDTKQLVETMVSVMTKVDLMNAIIGKLRDGTTVHWSSFMNPRHDSHVKSDLLRDQKKEVFDLLTSLGFVNRQNNCLSLPSQSASLSVDDCRNMLWNFVSQSEITTTHPPSKPKKCGRSDQSQSEITTTPPPPPGKGKKRGRNDVEEATQNQDKWRRLSVDELLKIFFTHLFDYVLHYRGFAIPLAEIIDNDFLGLSPNDFHQLMYFLSSRDAMWVLQRILMEIPHLNLVFPEEDVFLLIDEHFNVSLFNIDEMLSRLPLLWAESNVLHESAILASLKRKRQEQYDSIVREQSQKQFIHALATLRKSKKNMTSFKLFFQTLSMVCDDFDYPHTNWELLKVVVIEFMTIYNSTTGNYIMKQEPCEDPLQVFLEYSIECGVFSRSVPRNEVIRVCDSTKENCLFGEKCSGAHQDPSINTMWDSKRVFGMCCREYAKTFTCSNKLCQFPHYSGDEFYRALKNGGKDSFHVRNSLLAQAYIAKRQRTI
jgi:hypothetical protein